MNPSPSPPIIDAAACLICPGVVRGRQAAGPIIDAGACMICLGLWPGADWGLNPERLSASVRACKDSVAGCGTGG
jgi:hypothetical protein